MNILAIIPARAGSKRVKDKNSRLLGRKPLINWTIYAEIQSKVFQMVLVSTDSKYIADISKKSGAEVPWLRPENISGDGASSVDVVAHALSWYQKEIGKLDFFVLLQPTSPLRTLQNIHDGVNLFLKNKMRPVVSVSEVQDHPDWMIRIKDSSIEPFINYNSFLKRSQELEKLYTVNGSLYIMTPEDFNKCGGFISPNTVPLIIDSKEESIDIDTEWDWGLCEYFCKQKRKL